MRLPILALALAFTPHALAQQKGATPAADIKVPPGFKVELLKSATPREGSWVAMAIDDKGRLYISPQAKSPDGGIMRVTLDAQGQVAKTDWLKVDVGAAMGMLWAFDSLYVSGQGPDGQAIYRLRDTDGDGELDAAALFKKVPNGAGEHGAHALVVGPDGKSLYIAHGNSTPLVEGIAPESPVRNYAEDDLLPRIKDPVATFFDKLAVPYGQVLRTDADGSKWELFAGGFRNHYDIDFSPEGELFTYDSDMEWDIGLPWYRASRILHVQSGAEFGFREGSSKWPAYYPDSCPAVVDVGLGCPTGVKFGTKSSFPGKYKRAFFAMDWTFGRILAVHMKPKGATFTADNPLPNPYSLEKPNSSAEVETFLSGKGMPLTDLEFGKDGAMYFTVGGRGTQGGLYRVSYTGPMPVEAAPVRDMAVLDARNARRMLEGFHGRETESAVNSAWGYLGDADRSIRYAARVALEAQPVAGWRARALAEKDAKTGLTALLALARTGSKADLEPLLQALAQWPLDGLDEEWKLNKLRVIEVALARHGLPGAELVKLATEKLGRQFPAKSFALNRELSQLLVALGAPDVVGKTLALMKETEEPAEQIWYALVLREAKTWTPAQRGEYFAWFAKAREYRGGNSFPKFILRMKDDAVAKLTAEEKAQFAAILEAKPEQPKAAGPARAFVKAWTLAELTPELEAVGKGRNFKRGQQLYAETQCLQCHKLGSSGGGVGPDLTAVGSRFNRRDLLEAIIDPSTVISEQYASFIVTTKEGDVFMGQVADDNNMNLVLITDPIAGTKTDVRQQKIKSKEVSPVSLMPPALIFTLTKEEIWDLLAYIESGGNADAGQFKK